MKKILFVFVLLISFNGFSQLKVKDSPKTELVGKYNTVKVERYVSSEDYVFRFRNFDYQTIIDFKSFWIRGEQTFNELYELIINQLPKKEKKDVDIDLGGGENLKLSFKKKSVQFWYYDKYDWSYSCYLNARGINAIFGKTNQ